MKTIKTYIDKHIEDEKAARAKEEQEAKEAQVAKGEHKTGEEKKIKRSLKYIHLADVMNLAKHVSSVYESVLDNRKQGKP